MANALVRQEQPMAEQIEQVVIGGDLATLNASQRVTYYHRVCESVGLNPLTRPFEYLRLNGKLVLYARRDAADQLRSIHGISLSKPGIEYADDLIIVTIEASDKTGRTDTDLGAVSLKGLQGEARANAILKAITKAKRRVTLSLAGLGWLDETEADSIPGAQRVEVDAETGEIIDATPGTKTSSDREKEAVLERFNAMGTELYGDNWEAVSRRNVSRVSQGVTEDCGELSPEQVHMLIDGMSKLKTKRNNEPVAA